MRLNNTMALSKSKISSLIMDIGMGNGNYALVDIFHSAVSSRGDSSTAFSSLSRSRHQTDINVNCPHLIQETYVVHHLT